MRVLLLFVDGVGLGTDEASTNALVAADTPVLTELLDGHALTADYAGLNARRASLAAVDATLGVAGTPQSGTGQAALLTGTDTVALHGRHFGPWVPSRLRPLVRTENVLVRAQRGGHDVAFANAYPEEVLQELDRAGAADRASSASDRQGGPTDAMEPADALEPAAAVPRRRRSPVFLNAGPPLAAIGAGLLTRHTADLAAGNAVASEITNDGWRERLHRHQLPVIDAHRAGQNLAGIAALHELTLFAHYSTDYAGHRRDLAEAVAAVERLDAFVGGVLSSPPEDTLILIVSDHGNIEDVRTGHTRNPALGLVIGRGHEPVARRLHSLTDITPVILDLLAS